MENKKFSWIDLAGSDAGVRQPRGSLKYDVFPPAVRPASWGISVKWTWTNVVPRPATTAPFARILLIATSATAGQVSHSPVLWSSHFALKTSQPESLRFFFPLSWSHFPWILHGWGTNANMQAVVVSAECILPNPNHVHTPRIPLLDWKKPLRVNIMPT